MYNGIGLATVRGSGTNGYVQKNMAFVSAHRAAERRGNAKPKERREVAEPKGPNAEIVAHNRKRAVEVKVFRLREALEAQDVPEAQVDEKCDALRARLLRELDEALAHPLGAGAGGPSLAPKRTSAAGAAEPRRPGETHADAQMKAQEMSALKDAFGIGDGHVRGQAFDRELQERKKAERQAEREAHEAQLAEAEAILAREQAKEARLLEKEKRREEKAERKKEKKEKRKRGSD